MLYIQYQVAKKYGAHITHQLKMAQEATVCPNDRPETKASSYLITDLLDMRGAHPLADFLEVG